MQAVNIRVTLLLSSSCQKHKIRDVISGSLYACFFTECQSLERTAPSHRFLECLDDARDETLGFMLGPLPPHGPCSKPTTAWRGSQGVSSKIPNQKNITSCNLVFSVEIDS
jgi:hypothetical protein